MMHNSAMPPCLDGGDIGPVISSFSLGCNDEINAGKLCNFTRKSETLLSDPWKTHELELNELTVGSNNINHIWASPSPLKFKLLKSDIDSLIRRTKCSPHKPMICARQKKFGHLSGCCRTGQCHLPVTIPETANSTCHLQRQILNLHSPNGKVISCPWSFINTGASHVSSTDAATKKISTETCSSTVSTSHCSPEQSLQLVSKTQLLTDCNDSRETFHDLTLTMCSQMNPSHHSRPQNLEKMTAEISEDSGDDQSELSTICGKSEASSLETYTTELDSTSDCECSRICSTSVKKDPDACVQRLKNSCSFQVKRSRKKPWGSLSFWETTRLVTRKWFDLNSSKINVIYDEYGTISDTKHDRKSCIRLSNLLNNVENQRVIKAAEVNIQRQIPRDKPDQVIAHIDPATVWEAAEVERNHSCVSLTAWRQCYRLGSDGITLSVTKEGCIWLDNRSNTSNLPLFVSSPCFPEIPISHSGSDWPICRVPPGHSILLYDQLVYMKWKTGLTKKGEQPLTGLTFPLPIVHISLGKGWGPSYRRPDITHCPARLELWINPKQLSNQFF